MLPGRRDHGEIVGEAQPPEKKKQWDEISAPLAEAHVAKANSLGHGIGGVTVSLHENITVATSQT